MQATISGQAWFCFGETKGMSTEAAYRLAAELPSPDTPLKWSIQTVEGFAHIHSRNVLQGDIGCHNLLLDNDDNVKLCDFAGSSIDGSDPYVDCGKGFRRPTGDPDKINISDELFALGSAIYEIWTTRKPYQEEPEGAVDQHFRN